MRNIEPNAYPRVNPSKKHIIKRNVSYIKKIQTKRIKIYVENCKFFIQSNYTTEKNRKKKNKNIYLF